MHTVRHPVLWTYPIHTQTLYSSKPQAIGNCWQWIYACCDN